VTIPPSRRSILFAAILITSLLVLFTGSASAKIRYEVVLDHPEQHLFHVSMTIPDVNGEVIVQMAAWNALYQIRDFSAHVQQVEVADSSGKVPVEKIDKQTWRIKGNGTITVRYATYWDEAGPFATQLNSEHAFINPAMILMYVPARRSEDVHLTIPNPPDGWRAGGGTNGSVDSVGGPRQFVFDAADFDALADAPIEVSKFEEFQLLGVKPEVWVLVHSDNWNKRELESYLSHICEYELKLMDDAPFRRFTFILHIGKSSGGGGMEHGGSTAIAASSEEYVPGLAAHEFFHLWNVKRIRPATLEPVDYTREQYTRALWFAEGVTNTYGSYTMVRTGIWGKQQFYQDLGDQIAELEGRPANRWQSAEQSSLDAWFEKYQIYERPEFSISYYTKGQVLGNLLDILIRDRTDNVKSLDDVMRDMNENFAKAGKFYRDSLDVRLTAEKVAGGSFADFFEKYVAGAEPLPYQQMLALAGLNLRTVEHRRAVLGFGAERDERGRLVVKGIDPSWSAGQANLRVDDVIVRWNGAEPPKRLDRWIREQRAGDLLRLGILRDGKEVNLEVRLGEQGETLYQVVEDSHAPEKARRIREGLLKGVTQSVAVR
jgi:predicted metalloprotease with PDZ domain